MSRSTFRKWLSRKLRYGFQCCTRDELAGWAFGKGEPADVEVFINDTPLNVTLVRVLRPDVARAYPEYPHSGQSGFSIRLPDSPLDPQSPIANIRVRLTASENFKDLFFSLPSQMQPDPSSQFYWQAKTSPFPPAVMTEIEMASRRKWREIAVWTSSEIEEAVGTLLFLLKSGSRKSAGLFAYFAFLDRVAHACDFAARNFPKQTASAGKDSAAVGSTPEEHFTIAHHLYTLKAHGVAGDLVEFGCFKGFSTCCLSVACQILDRQIHVFDSFQGLPPSNSSYYDAAEFAASFDEVARNVGNFGAPEVVRYHKGFFADVLPNVDLGPIACIWMDVDLEVSARGAMRLLGQLDPRGCLFSHECVAELFAEDDSIDIVRGPEFVLPPVKEAFIAGGRDPSGRYLCGNLGAVWDRMRSVPVPGPAVTKLYEAMLAK